MLTFGLKTDKKDKFTIMTTSNTLIKMENLPVYEFNVSKIIAYLKRFSPNLPKLYDWKANLEKLVGLKVLTEEEKKKLDRMKPYDKEIILKEKLRKKLKEFYASEKTSFNNLCLWIVKDWGRIKRGKDEDTLALIDRFLSQEEPSFDRIASSSKVGSFMFPDKYNIYDSRVAYSLNWIILSENAGEKFFPIPEGRNSKMSAFDMNTLIRLRNIHYYKPSNTGELTKRQYIKNKDKSCYIPRKQAYSELNKLIKDINKGLWEGEQSKWLYYTEMLLFSIADTEVYNDITNRITLNMK